MTTDRRSKNLGNSPDLENEAAGPFLWNVHSYINEYIRFADTKAALVIAYGSALAGVFYAKGLHKAPLACPINRWDERLALSALAIGLVLTSVLVAVIAIMPQLRSSGRKGIVFWNDIVAHKNSDGYHGAVAGLPPQELLRQLSRHVYFLSVIARRKYVLTRVSMIGSLAGSLAFVYLIGRFGI